MATPFKADVTGGLVIGPGGQKDEGGKLEDSDATIGVTHTVLVQTGRQTLLNPLPPSSLIRQMRLFPYLHPLL